MNLLRLTLGLIGFGMAARAGAIALSTVPSSGGVSGVAGSTVSWGLSLTDPVANEWVVLNDSIASAQLTPLGTYVDEIVLRGGSRGTDRIDALEHPKNERHNPQS